jgi:hypothetical protein
MAVPSFTVALSSAFTGSVDRKKVAQNSAQPAHSVRNTQAFRAFSSHLDAHFLFSLLGGEGKSLLCRERYFSLAT